MCSLSTALVEFVNLVEGSTELGGEVVGLDLAGADVWDGVLDKSDEVINAAELSAGEVSRGDEEPDVEEAGDESTSEGVETLEHVLGH